VTSRLRDLAAANALISLLTLSCGSVHRDAPSLDARPFASFAGNSILCFDLRSDRGVSSAGLVLRVTQSAQSGRRDLILPFPTTAVEPSRNVLLASGSYDRFTILSMSIGNPSLGASTVAFMPQAKSIDLTKPSLDLLAPGLYYQESGLERWFVYVDGVSEVTTELTRDFPATTFDTYDAISVAIPDSAEGREVKKGSTVDPAPTSRIGNAMLFARPTVVNARRLAIHYVVPATAAQLAASNSGLKLLLVVLVPIVTLLFLDPEDIQRPRLRVIALWLGVVLQVSVVVVVVWAAIAMRRTNIETMADFVVAAVGVIAEVIVILVKAKRAPKA